METYPLPNHSAQVHVALFQLPPQSSSAIRARLVRASTLLTEEGGEQERAQLDYAFVDASMLSSRLHILTAINQALLAKSSHTLKTNTIHSEILWMLYPGSNISDSLKSFGLKATTTFVALIRVSPDTEEEEEQDAILERMKRVVTEGKLWSLDLLGGLPVNEDGTGGTDIKTMRKVYKLNQDPVWGKTVAGSEEERNVLDGLCISTVALKSVAS